MGNYGDLWGIMENYGKLWGNFGELWGIMWNYGEFLGNHGELWGIMGFHGVVWGCVGLQQQNQMHMCHGDQVEPLVVQLCKTPMLHHDGFQHQRGQFRYC